MQTSVMGSNSARGVSEDDETSSMISGITLFSKEGNLKAWRGSRPVVLIERVTLLDEWAGPTKAAHLGVITADMATKANKALTETIFKL